MLGDTPHGPFNATYLFIEQGLKSQVHPMQIVEVDFKLKRCCFRNPSLPTMIYICHYSSKTVQIAGCFKISIRSVRSLKLCYDQAMLVVSKD